jgi:hypothetical protein
MQTDNYNYNEPYFWKTKGRFLDNEKVIAEYWWLKPMTVDSSVWCQLKGDAGKYYGDFKTVRRNVRVVGTELQNHNLYTRMLKEHGWQIKDSWDDEMKDEYLDAYKANNTNPIIINLI